LLQCKSEVKNQSEPRYKFNKISGQTMGTTYNITYNSEENLKPEIDKILTKINDGVSTYIPSSTISVINIDSLGFSENGFIKYSVPTNEHFVSNYKNSIDIYNLTYHYFDPTIMPLINYWGFGYKGKRPIIEADSTIISQLTSTVGFDKWELKEVDSMILITKPVAAKLDFSGIAKGYGVDYLATFLENKKINDFMVEIGGEVVTKGLNSKSLPWSIGLSKPEINAKFNDFQTIVNLSGLGMASSGNYRNYYEVNGKTYGHEINPKTGYPEVNQLLGTSVIAPNCSKADGYATAFMVMGFDKSIDLIEELNEIEACFFFRTKNGKIGTYYSSKFRIYLKES